MNVVEEIIKQNEQFQWWSSETKVLAAISGGVDSMVLLDAMLALPADIRPILGVVHINHKQRIESDIEAKTVQKICKDHNIPCYTYEWQAGQAVTSNFEMTARNIRYQFIEKVMQSGQYNSVLTAHHQDDQAETIFMRLLKGNRLPYLAGIHSERKFGTGKLIRPLLTLTKQELYQYATEQRLVFYEDSSNQSHHYLRNRIRLDYLPKLETENPKFKQRLVMLGEEVNQYFTVLEYLLQPVYRETVCTENGKWQINLTVLSGQIPAVQQLVIQQIIREIINQTGLNITQNLENDIQQLVQGNLPNQFILLPNDWICQRMYEKVEIYQKKSQVSIKSSSFSVKLKSGIRLSQDEWLGFFPISDVTIPEKYKDWQQLTTAVSCSSGQQLTVRRRKSGDRIIFNEQGQTKKVSRYFIDQKIPAEQRESSWVVTDDKDQVIWLIPFKESYLSIQSETDKIHYKLIYCYR
ncbi:tRNA lysidine(34) synthetase TilS [Vagococcus vulneris]|uniref:tRNA(Ile)-lysidine synthase n=1 Tax=Vagococcus vulneris TaxID=1977869 RepID=A0A429ZSU6_9ENTE|nr:tRNA lysidine(34) synthetase TilS [Vagococcus vulneris]RST96758.1 tRNA lysidine(34) synthetase TilS [Vagococcus vulneris]